MSINIQLESGEMVKITPAVKQVLIERAEQISKHHKSIESDAEQLITLKLAAAYLLLDEDDLYPYDWSDEYKQRLDSKPEQERISIAGALLVAVLDAMDYNANKQIPTDVYSCSIPGEILALASQREFYLTHMAVQSSRLGPDGWLSCAPNIVISSIDSVVDGIEQWFGSTPQMKGYDINHKGTKLFYNGNEPIKITLNGKIVLDFTKEEIVIEETETVSEP